MREIIDRQQTISLARNRRDVGRTFTVLVEGPSKRSDQDLQGRNSANKVVVFPREHYQKGDYVPVKIHDCTAATLLGTAEGESIVSS